MTSLRSNAALCWHLVRIGSAARRAGDSIRAVALACATLALTVTVTAVVLVFASYEGRDARAAARGPVFTQSATASGAKALWNERTDQLLDRTAFSVVYIEPLVPDAPLPPGVSKWPEPGQAVMSGALLDAGAAEGIKSRYGTVGGVIKASGLTSPGELLVYARPHTGLGGPGVMQPISGYGSDTPFPLGDATAPEPVFMILNVLLFMAVLPAGALAITAARTGAAARDRRTALLTALGGGRPARAAMNVGEALVPTATGALIGAVANITVMCTDLPLPVVDFTIASVDARNSWPMLLLAPVIGGLLVLLAVVLTHPAQRGHGHETRPRPASSRLPRWWPYVFPVALIIAIRGPEWATSPMARQTIYVLGLVGTLATLPSVITLLSAAAGRGLARAGRRTGRSGALLAGRWMAAWPGAVARLTAGVVIAFVVIGQTQLWYARTTGPAVDAAYTEARVGRSVLLVGMPETTPSAKPFLDALPSQVRDLRVGMDHTKGTLEITGRCDALRALSLPCSGTATEVDPRDPAFDIRVHEMSNWLGGVGGFFVRATDTPTGNSILLVSADGKDLPVPEVKQAANAHLGISPRVATITGEWLGGAKELTEKSLWLMLFGAFGAVVVAISIVVGNLSEFIRYAQRMHSLSVLTGRRAIYFSASFFSLFLPLVAASGLGLVAHVWLASPLTSGTYRNEHFDISWPLLYGIGAGAGLTALLVWIWGAAAASRQKAAWRPSAD
ncbi:hypothetical protein [Streptomyces sp. NPDC048603]|uniref:hypothetical protein n=1 Tax=Streptomyces sp. NPDC048603 TaxID=3365577 RepID=UPI003718451F